MPAPSPAPLDPERLLTEDPFVRGLARQLLRDTHAADDLVQQTWVAALQAAPPAGGLRHWLAVVMRRLAGRRARSERHRDARQRRTARADATPSTADIVAREETRAAVVRAVLALEEPYRSTVLLRFFDHLSPRAIARRLSIPVETVRTRQKRALALLRARLDEGSGGRAGWCALLLPFARAPLGLGALGLEALGTTAAALRAGLRSLLPGALAMTTKAKFATLAAAAGGLLLLACWAMFGPPSPTAPQLPADRRVEAASAVAAAAEAAPQDDTAAGEAGARENAPVPAAPTTGSLLVHVVWGDDKTPAAGIALEMNARGDEPVFDEHRLESGVDGSARFDDVPPGRRYVSVLRGGTQLSKWVEVKPGQVAETSVEVEVGMNLSGTVVDAQDRPVGGADVLVSDWTGGESQVLARTAVDGTFAVRALSTHCHVGARADGYACSPMRQFTAGKGAATSIRIVLDAPAGVLTGTVFDPQNRPIADAVLQVGSGEQNFKKLADGADAMSPRPDRVRTDAQGRYAFTHLGAGPQPLEVRARLLAPLRDSIEVQPGRPATRDFHLQAGVTLQGSVRDAAGAPIAKAVVDIGEWRDLWRDIDHRGAHTDAAGEFCVAGLAVGELNVHIGTEDRGKAERKVAGLAGETVRCDVVLTAGLLVHGQVLDADGKPAAKVMVEARRERPDRDDRWFKFESTDAEGRFTLKDCAPDAPIHIELKRKSMFAELRVDHVVPGPEPLVLRLPREAWVYIQGKVLDPDGHALPNVHVSPFAKGGGSSPAETADAATGAFRYGPYPPGEYSLSVSADGFPPLHFPWRVLGPDEVWDLGTLRFQRGGTIGVNVVAATAGPAPAMGLSIRDGSGARQGDIEIVGGSGRSGPLLPGDYVLLLHGEGIACAAHACSVRAGVETRIDVPVQQGIAVVVTLPAWKRADGERLAEVVVRDHSGTVVARQQAWPQQGDDAQVRLFLLPGDYAVTAQAGVLRAESALAVAPPGPASLRLVLQ